MPRIVWVAIVCGLIALVFNLLVPLPYPWGYLLYLVLVVWFLLEAARLLGYGPPPR